MESVLCLEMRKNTVFCKYFFLMSMAMFFSLNRKIITFRDATLKRELQIQTKCENEVKTAPSVDTFKSWSETHVHRLPLINLTFSLLVCF